MDLWIQAVPAAPGGGITAGGPSLTAGAPSPSGPQVCEHGTELLPGQQHKPTQ